MIRSSSYKIPITILSIILFLLMCLIAVPPDTLKDAMTRVVVLSNFDHEGDYMYRIGIPIRAVHDSSSLILLEDGQKLEKLENPAYYSAIYEIGEGKYARGIKGKEYYYLYFSTSDNSDPRLNNREYALQFTYPSLPRKKLAFLVVVVGFILLGMLFLRRKQIHLGKFLCSYPYLLLIVVAVVSLVLHGVSMLSVPLSSFPDTGTYMGGVSSWVQERNLNGVSPIRGPGLAILTAPLVVMFGENATWAVKIFFHLMGLISVLLVYGISYDLTKNHWVAFISGILAAIWPDLIHFNNFLLTEGVANFFVTLTVFFAVRYIVTKKLFWVYLALITAGFATLVRTEALLLVGIIFVFVFVPEIWQAIRMAEYRKMAGIKVANMIVALVLASLPLLGWALHNNQVHGFFGLSNFSKTILYDGTITASAAMNQNPALINEESAAVKKIQVALNSKAAELHDINSEYPSEPRVGLNPYRDLRAIEMYYGISNQEAQELLAQAAMDTLVSQPLTYIKLIALKIHFALNVPDWYIRYVPRTVGNTEQDVVGYRDYWDEYNQYLPYENLHSNYIAQVQRTLLQIYWIIAPVYLWLRLFCVLGLIICLFRKPYYGWWFLCLAAFDTALMTVIMGMPEHRYPIPGSFLLIIVGVTTVWQIIIWLRAIFKSESVCER